MSEDIVEEVSVSDYLKMMRMAIKGIEELEFHKEHSPIHSDPAAIAFNSNKIKVLEEQLSNACDLIKVLAYLYEKNYITCVSLSQQPTSMAVTTTMVQHESPIDKMKRLIKTPTYNAESIGTTKPYSPKLKRRVLPDSTAAMIRTMLEAGVPNSVIAKQLEVDSGVISGISAGLTYRGVELPIPNEEEQ